MIRRATWLKYLFAIATVILVLTLVISGFRTLTGDYFLERINQPTGFIVSSIDIQTSIPPSTAASQFTILADMFLAVIPMLGVCWNSYRFFDGLAKGLTPFADSLIKNL